MKCEKVKDKLSLYIDNQLDLAESEQIKEHLNECEECRLYYNKLLSLGEMVDSFELHDNDEYWESQKDKVLDHIEQAESERITDVKTGRNRGKMYKLLAVAASIALVAIVSIYESKDIKRVPNLFEDKNPHPGIIMAHVKIIETKIFFIFFPPYCHYYKRRI